MARPCLRPSQHLLLLLTTALLAAVSLLLLSCGLALVYDSAGVTEVAREIKQLDLLLDTEVIETFDGFYSVFNKKGGWNNFAFVMMAIGGMTLLVSFFGCCSLHQEQRCLLLTYGLLLLLITCLLATASWLLASRDEELAMVASLTNYSGPGTSSVWHLLHSWLPLLLAVSCSLAGALLLLTSCLLATYCRVEEKTELLLPL